MKTPMHLNATVILTRSYCPGIYILSGPDAPFGSDFDADDLSENFEDTQTTKIMAFDVDKDFDDSVHNPDIPNLENFDFGPKVGEPTRVRKVALFEGTDEYGRLQPLLGTAEPATDYKGDPIYWPNTEAYQRAGLAGKQMEGTIAWHRYVRRNLGVVGGCFEHSHVYLLSPRQRPVPQLRTLRLTVPKSGRYGISQPILIPYICTWCTLKSLAAKKSYGIQALPTRIEFSNRQVTLRNATAPILWNSQWYSTMAELDLVTG